MGWILGERMARPMWRKLTVAVLLAAVACLLSVALEPWFSIAPLIPFYGAVALSVWYGGLASALVTALLSITGYSLFVIPPVGQWSLTGDDTPRVVAFFLFSLLLCGLSLGRDRAEDALRASERRFRAMLETANEGVWLIDRQARTRYANGRMAALLGTTPDRVATGSVLDFVFPEDAHAARERIAANLAGQAEEFDFRFRRADGQEILVLAGTSPVRDGTGKVVGALGLFTDVTARRRAERTLLLLDEAGRILASSLDYEETLQRVAWFAVPALADWCVVDLLDEGDVPRRVAVAHADPQQADLAARLLHVAPATGVDGLEERVIRTGEPLFLEEIPDELLQAAAQQGEQDGVLRAVGALSAMVMPLWSGGEIHGAMTLVTTRGSQRQFDEEDFTVADQLARRAAVAIQNARLYRDAHLAEARYRGLFEGTKDGILVFDRAGICVDVNPALTVMTGYSRQELVGKRATISARGGPWEGEEAERLRQDGQWRGEFELRRRNGTLLPVESWFTMVRLPIGLVYVGVLRDVADRTRFERLQEEFLSALAHDLKNPLTTVRGQVQLLQRRLRRGERPDLTRLEAALEGIDSATARMTRMLDELTDVTRLRAGQEIELRRKPADLVSLARRVVDEQARTTERHRIRLETEVAELIGFWDGPRLERVLGNLLGNAIKYSPAGGDISVRVSRESLGGTAQAVLAVADRGLGIPAGDLGLIFERFRRAGNVESFAGSGIGLAGAKRIVELHQGTITVTSSEGQGSTFTVRLPIAAGDD